MTEKEIAELRRRFKADKSNISHVRGCYVNENREIISEFDQSLTLSRQEESEKILAVLRKTLSPFPALAKRWTEREKTPMTWKRFAKPGNVILRRLSKFPRSFGRLCARCVWRIGKPF